MNKSSWASVVQVAYLFPTKEKEIYWVQILKGRTFGNTRVRNWEYFTHKNDAKIQKNLKHFCVQTFKIQPLPSFQNILEWSTTWKKADTRKKWESFILTEVAKTSEKPRCPEWKREFLELIRALAKKKIHEFYSYFPRFLQLNSCEKQAFFWQRLEV